MCAGGPACRRAHLNLPPWDGLLAARSSTSGHLRPCPASPFCPIAGRDSCCPLVPAELRHQKGWSRADVPRLLLGQGMHSRRWRPHPGLVNPQHIRWVTGPLTHTLDPATHQGTSCNSLGVTRQQWVGAVTWSCE